MKKSLLLSALALTLSSTVMATETDAKAEPAKFEVPDFAALADFSKYTKKEAFGGLVSGDGLGGYNFGVVLEQESGLNVKAYYRDVSLTALDIGNSKLVGTVGYTHTLNDKFSVFADAGISNYTVYFGSLSTSETGLALLGGVSTEISGIKTKLGFGSQNESSYTYYEANYKVSDVYSVTFKGELKEDDSLIYLNANYRF